MQPGEGYCRQLGSLLYSCYVFQALINSFVCCFLFHPRHHRPEPPQWQPGESSHSQGLQTTDCHPKLHLTPACHGCQPLLGVNLSPVFVNLCFPYAGQGLLFFLLVAAAFWIPTACVAVEERSNVVLNTHARLQISLPTRFLSLLY